MEQIQLTEGDYLKALFREKQKEILKQLYRNTEDINKLMKENKPRLLSNLYKFDEIMKEKLLRFKTEDLNKLLPEEKFNIELYLKDILKYRNKNK